MKMKTLLTGIAALGLIVGLTGCAPQQQQPQGTNPFTPGQVTMTLKKGVTTKDQVLNAFGSPNIVTQNSAGQTVWTYQKYATVQKHSSGGFYATVILLGGGSNSSENTESQNMMTLIITFDSQGIVQNFRSMYTTF